MRLPRLALAAALALVFLVALPAPWAAAGCAYANDDPRLSAEVDAIFTGQLVGNSTADLGAQREYTFRVDRVFKGDVYSEQIVATGNRGEDDLQIDGPGTFLVQARYGSGITAGPVKRLTSGGCDGTRLLADPAELPAGLGPARAPVAGSSRTFTPQLTSRLWIGGGIVIIVLAIVVGRRNAGRARRDQP